MCVSLKSGWIRNANIYFIYINNKLKIHIFMNESDSPLHICKGYNSMELAPCVHLFTPFKVAHLHIHLYG